MSSDITWTGKRIKRLTLYKSKSPNNFGLEHIPFIALYAWALKWCFETIGEQYHDALLLAEREGLLVPDSIDSQRSALASLVESSVAIDDASIAAAELKEVRLPMKYLPGFWALFFLGVVSVIHILIVLLQHWSVSFKCWIQLSKCKDKSIDGVTYVRITPLATHGEGKDVLQPIKRGQLGAYFEYHRRMYVYNPREHCFVKIRCQTALPISHFKEWAGLPTEAAIMHSKTKFGSNRFELEMPEFWSLYRQQLLGPLTIFQLFCTGLWLLDDYWRYSLLNLLMILVFEGTVVFQRLKSINSLKNMGLENVPIYVFRVGNWKQSTTDELLPGDIFSIRRGVSNGEDLVPCDCLLLKGSCVVNESTLTGESIPQMKEGLFSSSLPEDEELDLKSSLHKVHVLFGGTKLLTADTEQEDDKTNSEKKCISKTPDGGCLAYVLRTGFSSSQGKLVRMIEGSTETVRMDTRDTSLLLLLLLVFAISASAYVLNEGMKEDNKRSKYQLLLHCILIVTSVIPPELPMQMALAVNSSLMTLMKMNIFCTEPYRIPMAGKVDVCLFDKTGTLTTDELVAVGVSPPESRNGNGANTVPMLKAPASSTLILAGCQSLVIVDRKVAGDPVESAAMKAIGWEVLENKPNVSRPLPQKPKIPATQQQSSTAIVSQALNRRIESSTCGNPIVVDNITIAELEIQVRHHFSSSLQRMSVVVRSSSVPGGGRAGGWVLAKGSPEAILKLLNKKSIPSNYIERAEKLAKEGMRVLALAYKRLGSESQVRDACGDRTSAECDLNFAGFVAFTCRVRRDTGEVISALREGGHTVSMVTGDALLTALHVAKEVGITDSTPPPSQVQVMLGKSKWQAPRKKGKILVLEEEVQVESLNESLTNTRTLSWKCIDSGNVVAPFDPLTVSKLAMDNDLAVTGSALTAVEEIIGIKGGVILPAEALASICVFARMRPDMKERIIASLRSGRKVCLMCGDGANDVGALKKAEVGVALLSGFGDVNTDKGDGTKPKLAPITSQSEIDELKAMSVPEIKAKLREAGIEPTEHANVKEKADLIRLFVNCSRGMSADKAALTPAEKRAELNRKNAERAARTKERFEKHMADLEAKGESFVAVKAAMLIKNEETERITKERGATRGIEGSASQLAALMDGLDDTDVPRVKIGDASVASAFTSKIPSIRGCVDIIRQGRCTLVTSIQMYQILALTCLNSAYSLSVLYLDGVKYGDAQMTAQGFLMTVSFIAISRSKPLDRLSSVRPISSIFAPALIFSILGQFVIHLTTLMIAVSNAKLYLPDDFAPDLDGKFKPNMVNGVVFLINSVQQVSVYVVNIKGRPFMGGLFDNSMLLYSLTATFVLVFMCASEKIPHLNKWLQLEPFPNTLFRSKMLLILGLDLFASLFWDRLMLLVFSPKIFFASFENFSMKDVKHLTRVFAICGAGIYFLATSDDPDQFYAELEANEAASAAEIIVET